LIKNETWNTVILSRDTFEINPQSKFKQPNQPIYLNIFVRSVAQSRKLERQINDQ
jgi:hypothetical protein